MFGEMCLGDILDCHADDEPAMPQRSPLDRDCVIKHAATMLKQSSHGDIVDVAEQIHICKPCFRPVAEWIISWVKLPALRLGHLEPLSTVITLNLLQGQFISLNRRLFGMMDPETSSGSRSNPRI